MTDLHGNGAQPSAVVAEGIRKYYRLGEHRSLQRSLDRLLLRKERSRSSGFEALAGVDFVVPQGQSCGIVGTNGSGKSTLLQVMSGTT